MTERLKNILCGAISGVLATSAWTVGIYAWTYEAELLRTANHTSGALIQPVELPPEPSPEPPPPEPETVPDISPVRGSAADLSVRQSAFREWHAEMVRMGVPDAEIEWLAAQCWTESRWRPHAVSPVGAEGVCQFMPRTRDEEAAQTNPSCEGQPATDNTCQARMQYGYMNDIGGWLPRDGRTRENQLYSYNTGIGRVRKAISGCRAQPNCNPRSDRHMARRVAQEPQAYRKRIYSVKANISRQGFGATFGFQF